jgi:hypothetical protein
MTCNNDCDQGRKCNCIIKQEEPMNQFDERHSKFLRVDPYKHTEFEEETLRETLISSVLFVIAMILVGCLLYLN